MEVATKVPSSSPAPAVDNAGPYDGAEMTATGDTVGRLPRLLVDDEEANVDDAVGVQVATRGPVEVGGPRPARLVT